MGACAQGTEISPTEISVLPLTPADAPDASADAGGTADPTLAEPVGLQPAAPVPDPNSAAAAPPVPEQVSVQPPDAVPAPVSAESAPPAAVDAGAEPEPAPEPAPAEEPADAAPPVTAPDAGA